MLAKLLKELDYQELDGTPRFLPMGAIVSVQESDDEAERLIIVPGGQLDYIVKVRKSDYLKLCEMN